MAVTGTDLKELLTEIGLRAAVVEGILPDVPLTRQGLDSADFPAFAALLEERFGIALDEQETLRLRTLNDYAAYIEGRRG